MKKYDICLVGATGLVGQMFLTVLEELNFPIKRLKLLASKRSAGKILRFKSQNFEVEELSATSFCGYDLAFFSAGGQVSKIYAPIACKEGLTVIDNSSFWRQNPAIGLVVPEVNFEDVHLNPIIANPNCSTIQAVLPLSALHRHYEVSSVNYATYQAVSGSGQAGCTDLLETLKGKNPNFYPHNISQTCIPEIDVFLEDGYTKEELKMIEETQKILHAPTLPVSATCVRVPVLNGHGVSIRVELEKTFELSSIKELLHQQEGIVVLDQGTRHEYPTSTVANGTNSVYVGRLRRDLSAPNSLLFYCVADNIRKGAAANAVQIALKMAQNHLL